MGVVLSQLDRETDHITGRQRPQLADLKGSGALEAESDSVILIWKHNKKDKDTKKGIVPEVPLIRPVEFIFAKNRHGTSDVSVQMVFDEKYIEFREFDDEEETRIKDSAFGGNKEKKHEGGYSDPIE
jgi:replicative DNA helicase